MKETKIEWADATVNFWWGCTKVSPGCANCYADTLSKRFGKDVWGKGQPRENHIKGATKLAMKLNAQAQRECRRIRVFSASMSDWLDDEVPIEWLADMLDVIRQTPHLDWLLLTKRPELWHDRLRAVRSYALNEEHYDLHSFVHQWTDRMDIPPPQNVWIGTTVEDQKRADERIPVLLSIPAKVRFLSCEPLLGPVDLWGAKYTTGDKQGLTGAVTAWKGHGVDWVITGGESGHGCRPFDPEWARSLRDQCRAANVAFFMKQMGGTRKPFPPIPEDLRIQQFPKGGVQ